MRTNLISELEMTCQLYYEQNGFTNGVYFKENGEDKYSIL